mgnify:CR=1 FL=1
MKKSTFLSLILTLFLTVNIFAAEYYVSATGNDSNNGTSEATPFATIGRALTAATTDGDTIYIIETIDVSRDQAYDINVSLNFIGIGDSNLGRIKDDGITARTGGFFNVTAANKTITFQDMVFQQRFVPPTATGAFPTITLTKTFGGVISMEVDSDLNFTFCLFLGNLASDGGAIYFNVGDVTIDTCGFYSNAANTGGAINAAGSGTLTISKTLFDGNGNVQGAFYGYPLPNYGGAIFVDNSALTTSIATTVFAKNLAKDAGGALYFGGTGSSTLGNITVYDNTVTDVTTTNGGGIYIKNTGPFTILNSLIYDNNVNGGTADDLGNSSDDSDISLDTGVSGTIINSLAKKVNGASTPSNVMSNFNANLSGLNYETAEATEEGGFGPINENNRHVIFTAPNSIADDTPIDFGFSGEDVGEWDSEITLFKGTSSNWAAPTSWSGRSVPKATDNITITGGLANQPVISATTGAVADSLIVNSASTLTIESGGSLIVSSGSRGNITYERNLAATDKWYLVSSPVSGETIEDLIADPNYTFATGTGSNIGLAPYDNTQTTDDTVWDYQALNSTGPVNDGQGYSVRLAAPGDISFTGTVNTVDVNQGITIGAGNAFNLIGNPYPSYINSGTFLFTNTSKLTSQTIWVWNQATDSYETKISAQNFILAPAQGFFVECGTVGNVTFDKTNQSHNTDTFQRQTTPEIKLLVADETTSRYAQIYYFENATTGFDNGYDGELFGGVQNSFELYSHLLSDNQNKKYQIQSLPNSDYESMAIPVGVKADAGKEITFSVEALNLPTDLKVFLEDKVTNTFTRLDEANADYTVTLSEALDGVGRFYVHTSTSVLTVDDVTLNTISIYKSDVSTVRIAGLPQGNTTVKLFNILGKELINTTFNADGVKDISLPKLATGMYIIDVQTEAGKLNKKIILE